MPDNGPRRRHWGVPLRLLLLLAAARPVIAQEIDCDPGDTEVRRLTFTGNRTFSASRLAAQIATTPSGTLYRYARFIGARHCLDPVHLPLDSIRLLRFYQDRGFYDATVDLDTTTVGDHAIAVRFRIAEGQPMRIDTLMVSGLEGLPDSARIDAGCRSPLVSDSTRKRLQRVVVQSLCRCATAAIRTADVLRGYDTYYDQHVCLCSSPSSPACARASGTSGSGERRYTGPSQKIMTRSFAVFCFEQGDLYSAQKLVDARRYLFQTGAYSMSSRTAGDPPARRATAVTVDVCCRGADARHPVGLGWARSTHPPQGQRPIAPSWRRRQLELNSRLSKIGIGHPLAVRRLCTETVRNDFYSDTLNTGLARPCGSRACSVSVRGNIPSLTGYSEQRS